MDRRRFLLECGRAVPAFCLLSGALGCKGSGDGHKSPESFNRPSGDTPPGGNLFEAARTHDVLGRHPTSYYEKLDAGRVKCTVCPWDCEMTEGQRGTCGVRVNEGGAVSALTHGLVCDLQVTDVSRFPLTCQIEQPVLAVGLFGCSFDCDFCLSLPRPVDFPRPEEYPMLDLSPEQVVDKALELGCGWLGLGYFEATVNHEFALDISRLAHERGLKVMMDTNGFVHPRPLQELLEHVDVVWFGLKGFSEEVYREICHGKLAPALDTIKVIEDSGTFLGLNLLLFPMSIEPKSSVEKGLDWLAENVDRDTMINVTGFVPARRMRAMPFTPEKFVKDVTARARSAGFRYVMYVDAARGVVRPGHVPCYQCGKTIIERRPDGRYTRHIADGLCTYCGAAIRLPG